MKKIIVCFIVLMFLSCPMDVIKGFKFDDPHFESFSKCCEWIYENYKYHRSYYIKTPEQTIEDKTGDCSDFSVLLMAIMGYQHKIYISEFICLDNDHSVVYYNGHYYDCANNKITKTTNGVKILRRLTYYDIMDWVYR